MIFNPQLKPKAGYTIAEVGGVEAYIPAPKLVRVAKGTYTGTGGVGSSYKNTLAFDFVPEIIMVSAKTVTEYSGYNMIIPGGAGGAVALTGHELAPDVTSYEGTVLGGQNEVSWSDGGKTVAWWLTGSHPSNSSAMDGAQMNLESTVYEYIAIG